MIQFALVLASVMTQTPQTVPHVGMTASETRTLLGAPAAVSRQIVVNRCIEQWHYPAMRLSFDCLRGQKPRLVEVTPLP